MRGRAGDSLELRRVEAWQPEDGQGRRIGTGVIEISGAPGRVPDTRRLVPSADGHSCTDHSDGEDKECGTLLGPSIEQAAAPAVYAAIDAERRAASAWLTKE